MVESALINLFKNKNKVVESTMQCFPTHRRGLGQLCFDGGTYNRPPLRSPKLCVLPRIQKSVRKLSLSSTIFTKMILMSSQYWGHQTSSKVKLWQYSILFRKYACISETILVRRQGKKAFDSSWAFLSLWFNQIWANLNGLAARGQKTPK